MPTSTWKNISTFVEIVRTVQPHSFLDIGIGFGRWGMLVREFTDVWEARCNIDEWTTRIEGIEIYEPYISLHQKAIYNKIHIGDARTLVPTLGPYDLIMAGDVLEHMPKEDAINLINTSKNLANIAFVTSIPLGEDWIRKSYNKNQYEAHVSSWEENELISLGASWKNVTTVPDGRRIGLFCFLSEQYKASHPRCPFGMEEI